MVLPAPFGPMTARSSPGSHRQAHAGDGLQRAEVAPEPARLQHRRHRITAPSRVIRVAGRRHTRAASRRAVPTSPPGRKMTIRTKTTPVKIIQCSV